MFFIVIHKTAAKDYFLFVLGKTLYVKRDILCASVLADDLGGEILLALDYCLTDTAHVYVVAFLIGKFRALGESEGKYAPVYAVGAITLCSELVADICKSAENLLTGCRLLSRRAVARFICEYAGAELCVVYKLIGIAYSGEDAYKLLGTVAAPSFSLGCRNRLGASYVFGNTAGKGKFGKAKGI